MPEDAIRDSTDKNYEEYIAELETELSDAKQSNAALRDRVNSQQVVIDTWASVNEGRENAIVNFNHRLAQQDAITAWSMGFE